MMVVVCPHCRTMMVFSGKYRTGRQHCINCKGEIIVPEQPMTEEEAQEAIKQARPPDIGLQ